jgi:Family of unknown function (DUF6163)
MIDRRAGNAIEEAAADGGILLNFRDMGWTGRLAWYLRAMAGVSMLKGLYHWAAVCGIIGEEGGFEAHVQSWQATTVYFAVIDLVAAVGLWLMAPWGAVVWLTSTVSMIVVHVFFDQVYGTDILVIGAGGAAIVAYLVLAALAAREHPR